MKNFLCFFFILFFSSCQIFQKKKPILSTVKNDVIIYANAQIGEEESSSINLKTKITLSQDSLLIETYPIMGLKLAEVIINNDNIYINQKITNTLDTIDLQSIDQQFDFKKFTNLIMQTTLKRDSVLYHNNYIGSIFTNYKFIDSIFLPSKIIFWKKNIINKKEGLRQTVYLDYKSVKYSY